MIRKHTLLVLAALTLAAPAAALPLGAYTTRGAWSFHSAPNLHPPMLKTDFPTKSRRLARGYFMVTSFKDVGDNRRMVGQSGPLILDHQLQPVWFSPVPTSMLASTLTFQRYSGKPALSWWQGAVSKVGATISGQDVVVDQTYRKVATLTGKDGWVISQHEMLISGHNAWVTAYKQTPQNLVSLGGRADGVLTDSAVQEYDLTTGNLLYTWDAMQHIPLSQSQTRPSSKLQGGKAIPWDAYHVNSVQLTGHETFLVSMRNTWGVYLVDRLTSNIKWTAGGKASTFKFGKNAAFQWQHDARLSGSRLSVFDDHCCAFVNGKFKPPTGPSRGLVLKLDMTHHKATLGAQYVRSKTFDAAFLGNAQLLRNGNVIVGWGSQPIFTQFSSSGQFLLDAVWPNPDESYRVLVQTWVGKPYYPPSGAVSTKAGKATVYASWDGATQVASWRVLGGTSGSSLKTAGTAPKQGFETKIALAKSFKAYKVQALDSKGHVLGTSKLFPVAGGAGSSHGFY